MLLASLQLLAPAASALDLETFTLSSSALDNTGLQLESPTLGWANATYGGVALVYAHSPLVQVYSDGAEETMLEDTFATHIAAGRTFGTLLRLGVELPLYPYVSGSQVSGFSLGDARLRGTIRIPLGADSPVGLGIVPTLTFPTGSTDAYVGAGSFGGGLTLAAEARPVDALAIVANAGVHGAEATDLGVDRLGSGLEYGVGATWLARETMSVGLELDGKVDVTGGLGSWHENPLELHAWGRYGKVDGVQVLLGVGTGLVSGVGAPQVRAIGGLSYRFAGKEPIYDTDGDGLFDDVDQCVELPEDLDGFDDTDGCPDEDNDRDGVKDAADGCPATPEDFDQFQDNDGCPEADNDQDGVLDTDDQCPLDPGPAALNGCPDRDGDTVIDREDECPDDAGSPALRGCPDRDNDRVPDKRDKCPDEPIDPREDPTRSDGCPRRVFVSQERIEILEKVFFDTNKTTIKKQSYSLLDDVASVLQNNPDIALVEVAGHTDSVGNDKSNMRLSQGRADAVMAYLVGKGIDASRLSAVGYGETRPLETNETEAGRGVNRRVEFVIKAVSGRRPGPGPLPVQTPAERNPNFPQPPPEEKPAESPAPSPW